VDLDYRVRRTGADHLQAEIVANSLNYIAEDHESHASADGLLNQAVFESGLVSRPLEGNRRDIIPPHHSMTEPPSRPVRLSAIRGWVGGMNVLLRLSGAYAAFLLHPTIPFYDGLRVLSIPELGYSGRPKGVID
jgi:hypothetical protein